MDLEELNNELANLGNDYSQFKSHQVNFQEPRVQVPTEKISHSTKSGEHRNQFNERLSTINMQNFYANNTPNFMGQNITQAPQPAQYSSQYVNPQQQQQQQYNPNMYRYSEYGYNQSNETLKNNQDYRQNMNNKLDNMIFDTIAYQNPPLIKPSPEFGMSVYGMDSRMQLQGKGKTIYKDQTNERLAQYSPLSRAANPPVTGYLGDSNFIQSPMNSHMLMQRENNKNTISERMSAYSPLSRTVSLDANNTGFFDNGRVATMNESDYKQQIA